MRVRLGLLMALSLPLLLACPIRAQTTDPSVAAADAAYTAKQYASAISLYQRVVDSNLSAQVRARAQWRIGYSHYNGGDKAAARTAWLGVADRFPEQHRYACEGLLRAGNLASAAHDLRGAIDAYGRASASVYSQSANAKEYALQATCWLGNAYVRSAEQTRAQVAEQVWASGATPNCRDVWEAAVDDFQNGKKAFEQVVALFPDSNLAQEAAMQLVALTYDRTIYGRGGTFDDVVAAADAYLAKYPGARRQLAVVYQVRAEALYAEGRYDDALVDLGFVRDKYGDVAGQALGTSQYFAARCYERKGEFVRSISEFEKYLQEGKPSFDPLNERAAARLAIGAMLRIQEKWEAAAEALKRVGQEYPGTHWERQAAKALEDMASDRALA